MTSNDLKMLTVKCCPFTFSTNIWNKYCFHKFHLNTKKWLPPLKVKKPSINLCQLPRAGRLQYIMTVLLNSSMRMTLLNSKYWQLIIHVRAPAIYWDSLTGTYHSPFRVNFGEIDVWWSWYFSKRLRLYSIFCLTFPSAEILSSYSETIGLVL